MSDLFDAVFARICLERGWVSQEDISDSLKACEAVPADAPSLGDVLVRQGFLRAQESVAVCREVSKLLEGRSSYALPGREGSLLGQLLVSWGVLRREDLERALALQDESQRAGRPVPRLGEILVREGRVAAAEVEKALEAQRSRLPLRCSTCGSTSTAAGYDARKKYLCTSCAGILLPPGGLPPDVPEEVVRASRETGNILGKFVTVDRLGSGGSCIVWKAWDRESERMVALKILKDNPDAEDLLRFRREAMIAAGLRHPNIARIFEVGDIGERHVIALEYVAGENLYEKILPPDRAAEILAEVARAVHYAHEQEVLHRDLTPGNILVDRDGKPFVTDFGLARLLSSRSSITVAGTVMGTPEFMSPEQALGKTSQIDRSSEVYSLGAILFYVLTGQPPVRGATLMETLILAEWGEVTSPRELRPSIPPAMEAIVLRSIAKAKSERYASAEALAEDLDRFVASRRSGSGA